LPPSFLWTQGVVPRKWKCYFWRWCVSGHPQLSHFHFLCENCYLKHELVNPGCIMCYGKRMCLWHVIIVMWNQNMKQFHSNHGPQPRDFVAHCCSMSVWCLFAGQVFPLLVKKIQNYKWSYCWSSAEEWGNKTQPVKIIGVKFDFLKCYLILHPWSDLLPVSVWF